MRGAQGRLRGPHVCLPHTLSRFCSLAGLRWTMHRAVSMVPQSRCCGRTRESQRRSQQQARRKLLRQPMAGVYPPAQKRHSICGQRVTAASAGKATGTDSAAPPILDPLLSDCCQCDCCEGDAALLKPTRSVLHRQCTGMTHCVSPSTMAAVALAAAAAVWATSQWQPACFVRAATDMTIACLVRATRHGSVARFPRLLSLRVDIMAGC